MRFADLEHCPAGLFRDEAEKGYNAFALATEGGVIEFPRAAQTDRSTPPIRFRKWPFLIEVMGTTTSAIYQYASVPFVKVFGLTVASTRMASAATGTLTIALLGALLLQIWTPENALAAMLWLALCPWHYIFSRWALEGIFVPLGMVLTLAGIAGAEKSRRWGFPLAGAALGFIYYSYSGAQPFALLWGGGLAALYRKQIRSQPWTFAIGALIFLMEAAPVAWATFVRGGNARLNAVAIWTAEDATPLLTLGRFIRNYLAHFNPVFLLVRGDELSRHAIPSLGQLLLCDAALIPAGLYFAFKKRMPLTGALLLAFLFGPIGAAITRTGIPHGLRSLPMMLPAATWGGIGLAALAKQTLVGSKHFQAARLISVVCAIYAVAILAVYWRLYHSDPRVENPLTGFAQSHRAAFEKVIKNGGGFPIRAENSKVAQLKIWINGHLANGYAPYLALFFGRLPAEESAHRRLETWGLIFFEPNQNLLGRIRSQMAPGDWLIDMNAGGEAFAEQSPPGK